MRVAAIQCDIAWHDPATSRAGIERLLDAAALPHGGLAVLPELCDVGFTIELDAVTPSDAPQWAASQAHARGIAIAVGYPRRAADGFGRNECAIARSDGSLSPAYAKVHPFGIGRETEAYRGGERLVIVEHGGFRICPLICYDIRFPELWRLAALAGTDLFVVVASWPARRAAHWRALAIARAIENQAFVVACNRVGRDPQVEYEGGSLIVAPDGEVLAEAGGAQTALVAELDPQRVATWRSAFPALRDLRRALLGEFPIELA
jgi:predicted amidohydrolase